MVEGCGQMQVSKDRLLKEISKKNRFSYVFDKCDRDLQELFLNLVTQGSYYSCNNGDYVKNMDKTSIRFEKPYTEGRKSQNYCMFTVQTGLNRILVEVRTDGRTIESPSLNLRNLGDRYNGGFEWHSFTVESEDEIAEALRIISKCYAN